MGYMIAMTHFYGLFRPRKKKLGDATSFTAVKISHALFVALITIFEHYFNVKRLITTIQSKKKENK